MGLSTTLTASAIILGSFFFGSYIDRVYRLQRFWAQYVETAPSVETQYDFAVVGAGTAGSVVAGRLADAGFKVLLLEAGGPAHPLQVKYSYLHG